MQKKGLQNNESEQQFEQKKQLPQIINHEQIMFDQQCDQLQQEEQQKDDQKSFVDIPTSRKADNRKQKIKDFLLKHRASLPTTRIENGNLQDQLVSIQKVQNLNKDLQYFILQFNKKPAVAIQTYIKNGHIKDGQPKSIASYLMSVQGLDKSVLGQYFGKNNQNVLKVLHYYCSLLEFKNIQFDIALRRLLSKFRLPGQAQQIQRIIWEFSLSFYQQNKEKYDNADQLFPLAYSIIMLATDAHNPKQQKKMSAAQFVRNTQGPCPSIDKQYLQGIYSRITKQKLKTQNNYWQIIYARLKDMNLPDIKTALSYKNQLKKGDIVLKICRDNGKIPLGNNKTSKFVQRKLFLSQDQLRINWVSDPPKGQQDPRYIQIKDIIDLTLGIAPHLKKNNKVPKQFDSLCFTITTTQRNLDLKAKTTKQRSNWLNYLRAVMISRRQQKKKQIQNKYNVLLSKQAVQQAWNGDIFPNWDKYWDYQLKKPKQKGYFTRGFQALCCCFQKNKQNQSQSHYVGIPIKNNILETLWKYGLPHGSRKTLWVQIIGNSLQLNKIMIEDIKKRKIISQKFRLIQGLDSQIYNMAQFLITLRPDLPHVRDILQMAKIFYNVIPSQSKNSQLQINVNLQKNENRLISLANLMHKHHFLSFYRGQKTQIQLRTKLFQFLLQKNASSVLSHFQAIKLQTRMYLVTWFLSVFATSFSGQFLYRIWDNFLLQGQIYLYKVGLAIIKYYQIQLKMCTFYQGLRLLKYPKALSQQISCVLFFHIIQNQIDVKSQYYHDYIQKRKHAFIKTKVQSIPLQ